MNAPFPIAFFGGAPGGMEILVILIVVLLLFGAKKLPKIARDLGRSMEEFRRAARDVTDEIMHADDEPAEAPKQLPPEAATPRGQEPPPEDEKKEDAKDESAG